MSSSSSFFSSDRKQEQSAFVPALTTCSADAREFKLPPYFRGHTEGYYVIDTLVSAAQKCIRQCNVEDGVYVFAALLRAGYGNKGLGILFTTALEDVGPASGVAPVLRFLERQRSLFELGVKSLLKDEMRAHYLAHMEVTSPEAVKELDTWLETVDLKQWRRSSRAVVSPRATRAYMTAVLVMLRMPKSRLVACASGFSFALTEEQVCCCRVVLCTPATDHPLSCRHNRCTTFRSCRTRGVTWWSCGRMPWSRRARLLRLCLRPRTSCCASCSVGPMPCTWPTPSRVRC